MKQFQELVKVTPPTYESPQVDVEFIRKMLGTIVIKQHTWTTTERLKFPDQEELTELPTLEKEEVRKTFGTLVVTEAADATEEETRETTVTETDEKTTSPRDSTTSDFLTKISMLKEKIMTRIYQIQNE